MLANVVWIPAIRSRRVEQHGCPCARCDTRVFIFPRQLFRCICAVPVCTTDGHALPPIERCPLLPNHIPSHWLCQRSRQCCDLFTSLRKCFRGTEAGRAVVAVGAKRNGCVQAAFQNTGGASSLFRPKVHTNMGRTLRKDPRLVIIDADIPAGSRQLHARIIVVELQEQTTIIIHDGPPR